MRQITFNSLVYKRAIIHKILERQPQDACSQVEETHEVIAFSPKMTITLTQRLLAAMGRKGKGFYLEIWDVAPSGFYATCHNLHRKNDADFIAASKHLATKLAGLQTQGVIPESYLLFIEAIDETYNGGSPVYIAIKTEPHDAFKHTGTVVEVLEGVFLSPSQKLYKVGMLFEDDNPELAAPNDAYAGYLFDEQFGGQSSLAKYFYDKFLGFSAKNNGALQSKNFYDLTHSLIMSHAPVDDRGRLLESLRAVFTNDLAPVIRPSEFGEHFIAEPSLQGRFIAKVVNKLPGSFLKDKTLITTALKNRKVNFGAYSITGPDDDFADKVKVIKTRDELQDIDLTDPNITVIVMPGKPNVKPKAKPNGRPRTSPAA